MVMEENESCGSTGCGVADSSVPANTRHHAKKVEVYNEVLRRLKDLNNHDAQLPGFDDQLWAHFNRLPTRYALDVNVERAEDVLTHKRLLHLACDPANRPAFDVRLVQVAPVSDVNSLESVCLNSPEKEVTRSIHPPPSFGSSPNLEALALEASKSQVQEGNTTLQPSAKLSRPMHEITFSTVDKPKLLNQLTSLLAELGLNIQEAHVFSTIDCFSLDVFVVDGWPYEETELLRTALEREILKVEKHWWQNKSSSQSLSEGEHNHMVIKCEPDHLTILNDVTDVWEIDPQLLKFEYKIASGSYGDLYKGTYCSQEVAIKILKSDRVNTELHKEFAQEVYIMRFLKTHVKLVEIEGLKDLAGGE